MKTPARPQPTNPADNITLGRTQFNLTRDYINHGASGIVYKGTEQTGHQESGVVRTSAVAIKFYRPDSTADERPQSFETERRFLNKLDGLTCVPKLLEPNFFTKRDQSKLFDHLREFWKREDPEWEYHDCFDRVYYTVGQYRGKTWKEELTEKHELVNKIDLLLALATSVQNIHKHDILHLDLKPTNLLIDKLPKRPIVVLIDFGCAIDTKTGTIESSHAGTPKYMSPEQHDSNEGRITDKSDVWAIGVIMYELLTSEEPFSKGADNYKTAVLTTPPRPPKQNMPGELQDICKALLIKNPRDRLPLDNFIKQLTNYHQTLIPRDVPTSLPGPFESYRAQHAKDYSNLLTDKDFAPLNELLARIQQKVEPRDFKIGLILGPSGVGKTSRIQAYLLPRLENPDLHTNAVYVVAEGFPGETERKIKDRIQQVRRDNGLAKVDDSLAKLIEHTKNELPDNHRIVVFVDQFERWQNAPMDREPLNDALKLCDTTKLQFVFSSTQEFSSQFIALHLKTYEQTNTWRITGYAKNEALEILKKLCTDDDEQKRAERTAAQVFENKLSDEETILPIEIKLLNEVLKTSRPSGQSEQTPLTINDLGRHFLEKQLIQNKKLFNTGKTPGEYCLKILQRLLPSDNTNTAPRVPARALQRDIPPDKFTEHMSILEAAKLISRETDQSDPGESIWWITHDFMITPTREWLNGKLSPYEVSLKKLVKNWNEERLQKHTDKREKRFLPTLVMLLQFKRHIPSVKMDSNEKEFIRIAVKHHIARAAMFLFSSFLLATSVSIAVLYWRDKIEVRELVASLKNSKGPITQSIITNLKDRWFSSVVEKEVRTAFDNIANFPESDLPESDLSVFWAACIFLPKKDTEARMNNYCENSQRIPEGEICNFIDAVAGRWDEDGNEQKRDYIKKLDGRFIKSGEKERALIALILLRLGDCKRAKEVCSITGVPDLSARHFFIDKFPKIFRDADLPDLTESIQQQDFPADSAASFDLTSAVTQGVIMLKIIDGEARLVVEEFIDQIVTKIKDVKKSSDANAAFVSLLQLQKKIKSASPTTKKPTDFREINIKNFCWIHEGLENDHVIIRPAPGKGEADFQISSREISYGEFVKVIDDSLGNPPNFQFDVLDGSTDNAAFNCFMKDVRKMLAVSPDQRNRPALVRFQYAQCFIEAFNFLEEKKKNERLDSDLALTRMKWRLPTFEELKYAAFGTTSSQHMVGDKGTEDEEFEISLLFGNINLNKTKPCGSLLPNSLGVYDIIGNRSEWFAGDNGSKGYASARHSDLDQNFRERHRFKVSDGGFPAEEENGFRIVLAPTKEP